MGISLEELYRKLESDGQEWLSQCHAWECSWLYSHQDFSAVCSHHQDRWPGNVYEGYWLFILLWIIIKIALWKDTNEKIRER